MTRSRRSLAPASDTPMTDHARAVAAKARAAAPANPLASFRTVTGPGYTLIHGDCLEVLAAMASKSVDVCVMDPPYEAEAHTEQRRQKGAKITPGGDDEYREVNESPLDFDAITEADRAEVCRQVARVTRKRAIVFCQAEAVAAWRASLDDAGLPYRRTVPWVKPDAMPSLHGRWPGQGFESIVLAQFPSSPAAPVGGKARVYTFTRDAALYSRAGASAKAPHPTTKPLQLMRAIIEDFTDPGDVVIDPYTGSATTGIACANLGRTFIGIERSPRKPTDADYFEIACRRLAGDEAVPRECQPSLFDVRNAP